MKLDVLVRKANMDYRPSDYLIVRGAGAWQVKDYFSASKLSRISYIAINSIDVLLGLFAIYVGRLLLSIAWDNQTLSTLLTTLHYIAGLAALLLGCIALLNILDLLWMIRHFLAKKKT